MRIALLRAAGAVLACFALLGATVGVANAADTGPDSTACAVAGTAAGDARALLNAKLAVDLATTADADSAGALAAAKAAAVAAVPLLDVSSASAAQAAVAALQAQIDDVATPQGEVAALTAQRDKVAALVAAFASFDAAHAALVKAQDAFVKAGGDTALAALGVAGGIGKLLDAQRDACAGAVATPTATPTVTPAPTVAPSVDGSFTQVKKAPKGSAETGGR